MYFQPEEGHAVTNLLEAKTHNDLIQSFIDANSRCYSLQWFLNILKDSYIYIEDKKEYVKGSQKDQDREQSRSKKAIAKEKLQAMVHTTEDIPGYKWITKHLFYTEESDYEGSPYQRENICYLRTCQDTNFSNCLVPLDEFITDAIQHIDSCSQKIRVYQLADRLNLRYKDISKLFNIYKLEHWTVGLFDHESRYNGKAYSDKDIIKLLEKYQEAVQCSYIKDNEIVDYPQYTPYADFIDSPLPVHEDPDKYAMQA